MFRVTSYVSFIFSAMIIAFGIMVWKQNGFAATLGYILALFWLLVAFGYTGAVKALYEQNKEYEKILQIIANSELTNNKNNKEQK